MNHRIASLMALVLLSTGALADHHGRGKEPTSGFPGIYDGGRIRLTFTGDGHLIVVFKSSNVAASVQTYRIDGDVLVVQDVSPPAIFPEPMQDCARSNEGRYRMIRGESGYDLEVIEDPCAARAGLLQSVALTDYVRPAPETE